MAREKLNVEITATDKASGVISDVSKDVDKLAGKDATVNIDATDGATSTLSEVERIIAELQAEQVRIATSVDDNASGDLDRISSEVRALDGSSARVTMEARDNASGDIDRVQSDLRALDGETATVRIDSSGAAGIGSGAKGALAGLGLGAAFVAGAQDAAQMAIEVDELANLTGSSVEDAGRLAGLFATGNVEAKDLADIMLNVNQVLKDNPELAKQLGIEMDKNTSLVDVFVQAVDGITGSIQNAQDRGLLFSQLFGEEGARQVNAIVTALDTDLATALEQFSGPVPTDESVENARAINAELLEMEQNWQKIAVAALPVINGLLAATIAYFTAVSDFGNFVGNAGGDFRRFLLGDASNPNPGLDATINRNTAGFHGGAFGPNADTSLTDGGGFRQVVTNIFNPPGTPAATAGQLRTDDSRNGHRGPH